MTERIESALTPEQWADFLRPVGAVPADFILREVTNLKRGRAALDLYGQPFGFTWQDVDLIRKIADDDLDAADYMETAPHYARELYRLADRIAALLPPRCDA